MKKTKQLCESEMLLIENNQKIITHFLNSKRTTVGFIDFNQSLIVQIENFEHMQWVVDNYEWAKNIKDENEEYISSKFKEYDDAIPPGEHPEWHVFEMWESDKRSNCNKTIYRRLAKEGVARFGVFKKILDMHPNRIEDLDKNYSLIKEFANELELKLQLSKRD